MRKTRRNRARQPANTQTWSTVLHALRAFAAVTAVAERCGVVPTHPPRARPFPLSSMLLFAQGVVGQRHNVDEEYQPLLLIRHETDRQPLPNPIATASS